MTGYHPAHLSRVHVYLPAGLTLVTEATQDGPASLSRVEPGGFTTGVVVAHGVGRCAGHTLVQMADGECVWTRDVDLSPASPASA